MVVWRRRSSWCLARAATPAFSAAPSCRCAVVRSAVRPPKVSWVSSSSRRAKGSAAARRSSVSAPTSGRRASRSRRGNRSRNVFSRPSSSWRLRWSAQPRFETSSLSGSPRRLITSASSPSSRLRTWVSTCSARSGPGTCTARRRLGRPASCASLPGKNSRAALLIPFRVGETLSSISSSRR